MKMNHDRILTLHKECSIVRGMIDNKVIPKDVSYPVTITVRAGSSEQWYPDGVMIHSGEDMIAGMYFTWMN